MKRPNMILCKCLRMALCATFSLNVKLVRILISVCGDKLVSCNVGG